MRDQTEEVNNIRHETRLLTLTPLSIKFNKAIYHEQIHVHVYDCYTIELNWIYERQIMQTHILLSSFSRMCKVCFILGLAHYLPHKIICEYDVFKISGPDP